MRPSSEKLVSDVRPDHSRPDPDALLAEVNSSQARKQRGKLKIFFGMSAGVGKTYAMLEEARKRAAEGVDVLVGYAEPHIRPDTEAILVALDLLPYRFVEYRGTTLKEFDVDAALARRPTICCVDELAHSNAPGMRHSKRWQDIAELLDAGITVYSTLNVQHLESVNDLVERITGVQVRETLPDAVFDAADEVELVDIAPDELLERFREGRVYKPEQAARASKHFFTKGNLIALRELALRRTAERVDAQMLEHRRDARMSQIVPASETVLVCVGPSPLSARLVRSARRLASGLRANLIAVAVESSQVSRRSSSELKQLDANLRLAETLGAQVVSLQGTDVAAEVLTYAATHNVTKIVVGKPARARWKDVLFGSVVDDLIRKSGAIDIYVIRGDAELAEGLQRNQKIPSAGSKHDWLGYTCSTAIVGITTAAGWVLFHRFHVENENVLMLYLLGVLWVATRRGRGAAITASMLSVLAFDLTFVPPYGTLAISDRQYLVTFGVMLLTALVISALTHRVREQAQFARTRERRTAAVLQLSRDLSIARSATQVATATARHVADAIGGRAAILLPDSGKVLRLAADSTGDPTLTNAPDERELGVARWATDHAETAGRGTGTLPASVGRYVPLMDGRRARWACSRLYPPSKAKTDWTSDEQRDLMQRHGSLQAASRDGPRASDSDEARATRGSGWKPNRCATRCCPEFRMSCERRWPGSSVQPPRSPNRVTHLAVDQRRRRMLIQTVVDEAASAWIG